MKFILLLSLGFLCLVGSITSATERVSNKIVQTKNALLVKATDKRFKFFDLNLECVQLILDTMPVIDLFSMSNTSNTLYFLVKKTLKRRLPFKKMIFQYPYHSFNTKSFEEFDFESDDYILMSHLPKHVDIPWILKQFGHLIRSIEITHGPHSSQKVTKKLVYIVNSNCGKTLQQLQITNFVKDIFTNLRQPFATVEDLELNGEFQNFDDLSVIFPSARRLTISAFTISHLRAYGLNMSNLEYLSVADQYDYVSDEMKSILINHRQVRSLNVESPSLKLLQYAIEELTSLDTLSIDRIEHNDENETLNFEQLKRFHLSGYVETMPTNLVFRDLEEFKIENVGNTENLLNFTLEYKANLTKLALMVKLSNEELLELSYANLKVNDLKFEIGRGTKIGDVVKLIDSCRYLSTVDIYVEPKKLRISAFKALQKRLADYWMILLKDSHVSLLALGDFVTYPPETVLDE